MAVEAPEPAEPRAPAPPERSWIAADAPDDVGLVGLRQMLDRIVARHELRSLTVVVDDPDLGRQAFRAGRGAGDLAASGGPGVVVDPAESAVALDPDLLVALCAASLQVDVLRDTAQTSGELAVRRLPGVFGVEVDQDGDLTICRVHVRGDAPEDVGRVAARGLPVPEGSRLLVEVVRESASGSAPAPAAGGAAQPADATAIEPRLALLAVRSVVEDGEVEVHLALESSRSVGRAPLSRGLAGAVDAVLAAAAQLTAHPGFRPSWVRTIETTADGRFVVATALTEPESAEHRHGIATGSSPIEAAARAAVSALA